MINLAGAVNDAYAPDVEVEIVYKGDLPGMPDPPNLAVGDNLLGKDVTAETLEQVLAELLPD